jgi:hypothetical protein
LIVAIIAPQSRLSSGQGALLCTYITIWVLPAILYYSQAVAVNLRMLDIPRNLISIVGGWDSPASCYKIHAAAVLFLHEVVYLETCGGPYITNCTADCKHLNKN